MEVALDLSGDDIRESGKERFAAWNLFFLFLLLVVGESSMSWIISASPSVSTVLSTSDCSVDLLWSKERSAAAAENLGGLKLK